MSVATTPNGNSVIDYAKDYVAGGLSVVPIRADGSKAAAVKWEAYQKRRPTSEELQSWFQNGGRHGVAIAYGEASGNAENIDIDEAELFHEFKSECERIAPGLLDELTLIRTPRPGYHVVYRSADVEGNQKLAMGIRNGKPKAIIETRGVGGYALAPGCPLPCNPNDEGRLYEHVSGPPLNALTTITSEERAALLLVARSFNEIEDEPASQPLSHQPSSLSPGDDYNSRATWDEILEPHGWCKNHIRSNVTYWRRPGKDVGWSATSGHVSKQGNELFCCFSDNAYPFQGANGIKPCSSYSKFAAYAILNHDGDFSVAARELGRQCYGEQSVKPDRPGMADLRPAEYRDQTTKAPPPRIEFKRITSAELSAGDYELEYLVENAMVAGQPLVIAGPQKTLKTSILIDAAVSLESAGYFLGRFKVNRACRVAVMTGESGLATIQESARRICVAAGVRLEDRSGLIWSPDVPKLASADHLDAIERFLANDEIEVLFIDPAYLAMPAADAGNMMAQGELLRNIGDVCGRMGVTLVIAHHSRKNTGRDPNEPLELQDIAWAGFAEFARQWWLVNRREKYEPGSGSHRLWLSVGGSAGHGGLWALDVNEGNIDDLGGRCWEADVHRADEARDNAEKRRADAKVAEAQKQLEDDRVAACRALAKHPNGLTKTAIGERAGIPTRRWPKVFAEMYDRRELVECDVVVSNHKKRITGYRLGNTVDAPE